MKFRILAPAAVVAVLLLAGCTAQGPGSDAGTPAADGEAPDAPSPAASATPDDMAGSVTGLVLNEEELPVVGVQVSVVETRATTTSDALGKFTFNHLEPGEYRLVFERVGYEDAAKAATVAAGQIFEVTVRLVPIQVAIEPYHQSLVVTAHIKAQYVFVGTLAGVYNETGAASQTCDPCQFTLPYDEGLREAVVEGIWERPAEVPGVNEQVYLQYYVGGTDETAKGTAAHTGYLGNREKVTFTGSSVETLQGHREADLYVHGGFFSVSVDHKPDIWTTFAYGATLPDSFTALPPG